MCRRHYYKSFEFSYFQYYHNDNFQKNRIIAGAGTKLGELVDISVERGLTGLEWAVGIPGSMGAAVYGNVGAFGSIIAEKTSPLTGR